MTGKNSWKRLRSRYIPERDTPVAGIIAGEIPAVNTTGNPNPGIRAYRRVLESDSKPGDREIVAQAMPIESICGMAPRAGLVSLRVLDENGVGAVSTGGQ